MKKILLITLGLCTALFASFSKKDNIVIDNSTGLQWQDDIISSRMSWSEAIDYCENLSVDAYGDWRLPNMVELTSIVDDTRIFPNIDTSIFNNTMSHRYWSSTTYAGHSENAWYVGFAYADQYYQNKNNSYYVRCVRNGQ